MNIDDELKFTLNEFNFCERVLDFPILLFNYLVL